MGAISKFRHHPYAKIIIPVVLIVCLVFGLFFSLGFLLNTDTPLRVVESSSMCIPNNTVQGSPYTLDDFLWTVMYPFNRTLNVGDIIVIQGVDPKTLNANYPNSDIIVYNVPDNPEHTPIVHRIVKSYEKNGILYFETKGDGNDDKWPQVPPEGDYDSKHFWQTGDGVPADLVEGKVIMRIPYLGWFTLFLNGNSWGLPVIIALILLLVVLEFIVPVIKRKPKPNPDSINLAIWD